MERPGGEKGKVTYSSGGRVTTYASHSMMDSSRGSLLVFAAGVAIRSRSGALATRP
jgi:hypothetical protein